MSLFRKIKNIIRSNINFQKENNIDLMDINEYEDFYFQDAKEVPSENVIEKKYYQILELEYGADFQEIKKAYKRLLKKYHPDLFINNQTKQQTALKLTKKINEAYTYFERKFI